MADHFGGDAVVDGFGLTFISTDGDCAGVGLAAVGCGVAVDGAAGVAVVAWRRSIIPGTIAHSILDIIGGLFGG